MLRREDLYDSSIKEWRQQIEAEHPGHDRSKILQPEETSLGLGNEIPGQAMEAFFDRTETESTAVGRAA